MIVDVGVRRHRWPAAARLVALLAVVVALLAGITTHLSRTEAEAPIVESPPAVPLTGPARFADPAMTAGAPGPGGDPGRRTLVLYEEGGAVPQLGHQYAIQAATLASRGGSWVMRPVAQYRAGDLDGFQAMIHIGTDAGPLPAPFLADVAVAMTTRGGAPVLWMGTGIDQLFAAYRALPRRLGWSTDGYDPVDVVAVEYGGRQLKRRTEGNADVVRITVNNARVAQIVGLAVHPDGSKAPWAVRSANLTFIGEVPFAYMAPGDRYLAAADLILRTVAPPAPERRRALIRIEDVGPNTPPADITAVADFLSSRKIPFTLAVYPYYRDPRGAANRGRPTAYRLVDRPEVVRALQYAVQRGGMIVMHGLTHQYEDRPNPYTATSGEDFEFYQAHLDAENNVRLDGPVPQDSVAWALQRLSVGRGEFVRVGLPDPAMFEFPHYTGSVASYRAAHKLFGVRYDQGSYFDGLCPQGNCADESAPAGEMFQQFFPYPVRDVYGSVVIPENLLNISEAYNNNPARSAEDVVANAEAMTVVRDAVASGFFHPYLGVEKLARVVDGIAALGYTFVSPDALLEKDGAR